MADPRVTLLLDAVNAGEGDAYQRLMTVLYDELRRLAQVRMLGERPGHTLQPTVLVNEAWLRMAQSDSQWENRAHFFGAAAEAMRRILVEHARKRSAHKRGGEAQRVTFHEVSVAAEDPEVDLIALDDALEALAAEQPRLARLVHLRYFAGLSIAQAAEVLGISPATAKRDWVYARAWLYERMTA